MASEMPGRKVFGTFFLGAAECFFTKKTIKKMSDNMRFVEVAGAS